MGRLRSFVWVTRFAWALLAKIILFGLLYWAIFFFRPDAFNFVSGYNSNPLSTFHREFFLTEDQAEYFLNDAQDLTGEFRSKAAEVDQARRTFLLAEQAEEAQEADYQKAIDIFQDRMEERIDEYRSSQILPLEAEEEVIQERMDALPFGSPEAITLSEEKLRISEEILSHLTYIVENRMFFASDDDQVVFEAARERRSMAREETQSAGENYRSKRAELLDHFVLTRNQMLYQIGFVDFLYFSACISTTTTFGDITANLPWVRFLVVIQIFAGVLILAGFLNGLSMGLSRDPKGSK
jgi:hypothetical protein